MAEIAKEQTIRELLADCGKIQSEIQAHLGKNFDRSPCNSSESGSKPSFPNVLDEIIADLQILREMQKHTLEFIATEINPKL